jgi:hypothetical protein
MSHHENMPPTQVQIFGLRTTLGFLLNAAQARCGDGTSPPGGLHERWKIARPTFELTAMKVKRVPAALPLRDDGDPGVVVRFPVPNWM